MTKKLQQKLDAFLKVRHKSETGEWPEVDQKDVDALNDIIHDLIAAKWDGDYGGSRPVAFLGAINRRKVQKLPWHEVIHEPCPEEDSIDDLCDWSRSISANLQIAANAAQHVDYVVRNFAEKYRKHAAQSDTGRDKTLDT